MEFITAKIAGIVIGIGVNFHYTKNLFKDFICEEKEVQFMVQCTIEDYERAGVRYEKRYHCDPPSDIYLEEYAIFEKIYEKFIEYGIITFHGAALAINNQVFIFSGPSKIGKTTHINKWIENIPGTFIVNGDKPFIRTGELPIVCGSPWSGKEHQYSNSMLPLKAIIVMERSEDNHIEQMAFKDAFPFLIQQTFRPESPERLRKTLEMLRSIGQTTLFYRFQCNNLKGNCLNVVYNALLNDINVYSD